MEHLRVEPSDVLLREGDEQTPVDFILSTYARDSHRTIVNQAGWQLDRYNRNPIVGYQHNVWGAGMCNEPDPDFVIGKSVVSLAPDPNRQGKQMLVGTPTFEPREINELAEKVRRKVIFGSMRATSVGFGEIGKGQYGEEEEARGGANETYYFQGQELFEWSIVNMGSNPETVKRSLEADTRAAIAFIKTRVPNLSTRDIMKMTVADILREIDDPVRGAFVATTKEETKQGVGQYIQESLKSLRF